MDPSSSPKTAHSSVDHGVSETTHQSARTLAVALQEKDNLLQELTPFCHVATP
jgi:hypothetical protein